MKTNSVDSLRIGVRVSVSAVVLENVLGYSPFTNILIGQEQTKKEL